MSRIRQANGDDHPEAAGKHFDDATALLGGGRNDGTAYLSGYVVECALKSLVLVEGGAAWGHVLGVLSSEALRLAALPGARTARYAPRIAAGHSLYDPVHGWRETLRYREPFVSDATATSWLAEAQAVLESTVIPMRIDGVI